MDLAYLRSAEEEPEHDQRLHGARFHVRYAGNNGAVYSADTFLE